MTGLHQGVRMLSARLDAAGKRTGDTTQTVVPWWSFTKTLLASAALLLVEQGRLNLDSALPPYPFTLRQLLQHRAGLPDYGGVAAYQEAARRGDSPWNTGELLRQANAAQLIFEPGQGWLYSNIGYLLVREIIEQTTGQSLGDALNSLILSPAGLHSVRLASGLQDLGHCAWGNAAHYHPGWVYHGLAIGTPIDAATFLHLLITGEILPAGLLAQMLHRHPVDGADPGRPWTTTGYGLGLMLSHTLTAGYAMGHSGSGPGSSAAIYHFMEPEPHTAAIFTTGEYPGPAEFEAAQVV